MNKKQIITSIMLIVLLIALSTSVLASSSSDVSIVINSEKEQYTKQFDVDLNVHFTKKELYNDKVFLSYHVYDENHKQILWEGERFPIKVDEKGIGKTNITINMTQHTATTNLKTGILEFDLVDEKNIYWFSINPSIKISSEKLIFSNNFLKKFINTITTSISKSPFIFIINCVIFLLFIYGAIKFKKKGN